MMVCRVRRFNVTKKIAITPSSGDVFDDLGVEKLELEKELYAQADRMLPLPTYAKLNYLLKYNPENFAVSARDHLPSGTTNKALANLAKKLYILKGGR
jgi:hypothetical protein